MDSLPTEIVRTIASFTPAESVLRLCAVNHKLRQICYDQLVFRSCIEQSAAQLSRSGLEEPSERQRQLLDIEALTNIVGENLAAWARLAVANSLALSWAKRFGSAGLQPEQLPISLRMTSQFVPQLLVIGHPWLYQQVTEKLGDLLEASKGIDGDSNPDASYWSPKNRYITRRASRENAHRALCNGLQESTSAFWHCISAFSDKQRDRRDAAQQMNYSFVSSCQGASLTKIDLSSTMSSLATWSWVLNDFLASHPMDSNLAQPSNGRAARLVPRLEDFPWHANFQHGERIPLPFMSKEEFNLKVDSNYRLVCWEDWLQGLIGKMSETEYLEQDSWCGYWSFERNQRAHDVPSIEFADAVEGLNIRVTHDIEYPVPGSRRIIGTYTELAIDFHLEGYITPQGKLKLGPPGEFWTWMGWMTPFGMFGFWGSAEGDQAAGACWLWQRSVSEGPNAKRGARGNFDDPENHSVSQDEDE